MKATPEQMWHLGVIAAMGDRAFAAKWLAEYLDASRQTAGRNLPLVDATRAIANALVMKAHPLADRARTVAALCARHALTWDDLDRAEVA